MNKTSTSQMGPNVLNIWEEKLDRVVQWIDDAN